MSTKKPELADKLPISENETGILIKWKRDDATFEVNFEGKPMHYESFKALMESVTMCMQAFTNDTGMIVPSLPEEEAEATQDQMPINKQQKPEKETDENDNVPSWLKN